MARVLRISYLSEPPMKPADADFGVTVDFRKGEADPVKIFEAISELLEGFREFDRVAIGALDSRIEPIMVLEDVEASSITAWVRNKLRQVDDEALKDFDWKKQIGAYAVKAKYIVIEYLDKQEEKNERERLSQLRDDLQKLTKEPQFRHLPLPGPVPLEDLAVPLDRIQEAKQLLSPADRLIIKADDREHEIDLSSTKKPSDYLPHPVAAITAGQMPMTLLVRKPDYLGDTLWGFRHGKQTIEAYVKDVEWLERFRAGQEIIVPGSALVCLVNYEYGYDDKGELRTQKHEVMKVLRVINQLPQQQDKLF